MSLPSTLYHYCSTSTFHNIVRNKTLRLSSLSLSNDLMEGKLVAHTIQRLSIRDSLDSDFTKGIIETLDLWSTKFDGLGFCLSKKGDLLSQWRGYADDGTGVAIGFASKHLQSLSMPSSLSSQLKLEPVRYKSSEHECMLENTYRKILQRKNNEITPEDLSIELLKLYTTLYLLKPPAFVEENEWRLITCFYRELAEGREYQVHRQKLVPFYTLKFSTSLILHEIILGPKHLTPERVIKDFLRDSGFPETNVRRSKASYR